METIQQEALRMACDTFLAEYEGTPDLATLDQLIATATPWEPLEDEPLPLMQQYIHNQYCVNLRELQSVVNDHMKWAAVEFTKSKCLPIDPLSPASATGNRGAASATGDFAAASATGEASVAISTGYSGKAMARDTGAIVLVKRDEQGNIKHIRASKVGDNGIKPDTWYELDDDGQFAESME